jgi:hypothetical protein
VSFTAFTGRRTAGHTTAQLIVRRVKRLTLLRATGQGEPFTAWRYYPVFTDTPHPMLEAGSTNRPHAIVEHVLVDLTGGPLAHLPSGSFRPTTHGVGGDSGSPKPTFCSGTGSMRLVTSSLRVPHRWTGVSCAARETATPVPPRQQLRGRGA